MCKVRDEKDASIGAAAGQVVLALLLPLVLTCSSPLYWLYFPYFAFNLLVCFLFRKVKT